jgi:hypothetical protein
VGLALLAALACGENEPPVLEVYDAGEGWAPWPPRPGDAGFRLEWTVEGEAPTDQSCAEIDLAEVRLRFLHPVADFETWTAPDLTVGCAHGETVRPPTDGLAPGRYRFEVELLHPGGLPFQQQLLGEVELLSGEITLLAAVNVTEATPADGGE